MGAGRRLGAEAVQRATPPLDVALIDIGLPDVDGYDVARRIRATAHGKSAYLIALTGYGQAEDRRRAEEGASTPIW